MRRFFSTVKFKVLVCLLALMAGFMGYAAANGRWSAAPQELLATALVPFQQLGRLISGGIDDVRRRTVAIDEVLAENETLRAELDALRRQMVDYDDMKAENEMFREYYQLEDTYEEYELVSAFVIGRDPLERYYAFTIDRGSRAGVAVNNVVISPQGVVGRVTAVGYNWAEVLTVLDPAVSMGCTVSRTRDIGLAEGDSLLSQEGLLKMSYLPRETLITSGDLVVTTGLGGVFPAGLVVGTVNDVRAETSGKSMYAVVTPTADIPNITSVFVITSYESDALSGADAAADAAPVTDGADDTQDDTGDVTGGAPAQGDFDSDGAQNGPEDASAPVQAPTGAGD